MESNEKVPRFKSRKSFVTHLASETTPLIGDDHLKKYVPVELAGTNYPSNRKYHLSDTFSLFRLAWQWHRLTLILVLLSVATKCLFLPPDDVIIDSMIFKAIFVVIGFCLGFRTVGSNKRLDLATVVLQGLFSSIWNIILIFPSDSHMQRDVVRMFLAVLEHCSVHVQALCGERRNWWTAVIGVTPKPEGLGFLGNGPRTELIAVLDMVEALIYKLEPKKQTKKRALWHNRKTLLDNWDKVINICLPAVTDRYAALLDICLTVFGLLFPWGITARPLELGRHTTFHIVIPAQLLIIVSSLFVMFVLLGINANAQENEDPLGNDERDLKFSFFCALFEIAAARNTKHCNQVREAMQESEAAEGLREEERTAVETATICEIVTALYREEDEEKSKPLPKEYWEALRKLSSDTANMDEDAIADVASHMRQTLLV